MLVRLWRKVNPHALVVGRQIGPAIMEISIEFLQKIKNEYAL